MDTLNSTNSPNISGDVDASFFSGSPYTTVEIVVIILVAGSLSLVTVIGNILVMLSIKVWILVHLLSFHDSYSNLRTLASDSRFHVVFLKVNRNLKTVNNYFLFSLACADLIIGICSMNLYTVYIVIGYWPLGAVVCDLWLAVDYVVSNASVMNLLIISFDRYFCVTKPLSYPARRSTKMAGLMIAAAWVLSFVLWAPAILFWQFIVGGRTVPQDECYIQFFSNPAVTFGTAIAAFYLPVAIMIYLYWRISRASRSRMRRNSRKISGTSMAEPPSHSQEDAGHNQNNCHNAKGERREAGDGQEKKILQPNGIGPCEKDKPHQIETMEDCIIASTSNQEVTAAARRGSNVLRKTIPIQPPSPEASAADRQSLVARTLIQVNYKVLKVNIKMALESVVKRIM